MAVAKKKKKAGRRGFPTRGRISGGNFTNQKGGGLGSGSFASGLRDAATSMGIPYETADAIHTMASMGEMTQADALSLIGLLSEQQAAGDMQASAQAHAASEGAADRSLSAYLGGLSSKTGANASRERMAEMQEQGRMSRAAMREQADQARLQGQGDRSAERLAWEQEKQADRNAQAEQNYELRKLLSDSLIKDRETKPDRIRDAAEEKDAMARKREAYKLPVTYDAIGARRLAVREAYAQALGVPIGEAKRLFPKSALSSAGDAYARYMIENQGPPPELLPWLEQTFPDVSWPHNDPTVVKPREKKPRAALGEEEPTNALAEYLRFGDTNQPQFIDPEDLYGYA